MKKKSLIVFDLDGTIEDSRLDMSLSVNRVRKLYGLAELPLEAVRSLVNKGMDFLYKSCFPELVKDDVISSELIRKYEIDYAEHIVDHTQIYADIDKVLKKLYSIYPMIVYTNKPEGLSRLLLKKLNLLDLFIDVIGGDTYSRSKPDPEPVQNIIKKHQISPEEIFVIGDSEGDIQTAKNLQAKAIWCKWGYSQKTPEIPPDYIAIEPLDILKILEL